MTQHFSLLSDSRGRFLFDLKISVRTGTLAQCLLEDLILRRTMVCGH